MEFEVILILASLFVPSIVINIVSWILMDRWMARKYRKLLYEVGKIFERQTDE